MTDLLSPATSRAASIDEPRRPLGLSAGLAGAAAAVGTLLVCMALGLTGWFASQAGAFGAPRDALRVGADAWLLAHGSPLALSAATITVVPLGMTLLCGYVAFRMGRWAGGTSQVDDLRTVLLGSAVLAGLYAVVAMVTAVLCSLEGARTSPGLAVAGGLAVSLAGGLPGILSGSGQWPPLRERLPGSVRCVAVGVTSSVLLLTASASVLLAGALVLDFGSAANVIARLHADTADGLLYTVVVAAVVPNAVLLGGSYLVGPGFMVGTGTLVSPSAVVLGPVPAFPLLAALPDDGATPWWTPFLVAVPVLVAAGATCLALSRFPVVQYELGAIRGLAVGVLAGVLFGGLTALAGGSVGPGRMADVGALVLPTMLSAGVAMGVGGPVGGVAMTWWLRRRDRSEADPEPGEESDPGPRPADPAPAG